MDRDDATRQVAVPAKVAAHTASPLPAVVDAAVVDGRAQLSYAQLLAAADQVAAELQGAGVSVGALVGVCLPRSAGLTVATLGIMRANAAYVALDPAQPLERLRAMLADSGAQLLVTTDDLCGALEGETVAVLPAVGCIARVAASNQPELEHGLAYVVYTSGSTGSPKGVLAEHRGLTNLVDWHRHAFGVKPGDRCSQIASPGFDATVWETWGCLANGATLVIPPEDLKTDPVALRDWLVVEQISVCFLPTPLAEVMLTLSWPDDVALRFVLTGGDRLHRSPPVGLPFALVNNYGVSEATVVSTSATTPAGEAGRPSIGAPVVGVDVRIVDAAMRDVADGDPGELVVGGVSVARGYLNAPELTSSKFSKAIRAGGGAVRWYRTGDVVRRRADGELDYLGRLDDQVQVRGHRIEPGEIVAALAAHPAVANSVVVASGTAEGQTRLVAYLTSVDSEPVAECALREHLSGLLPPYMVPSAFVQLAELPISLNGKVDVAALPPPPEQSVVAPSDRLPADELEERIASIVAEVLDRPTVGLDENFLLLGGHSLLGAQLVNRVAEIFGVDLTLRALFEGPTPAEIADAVRQLIAEQVRDIDDEAAEQLVAASDSGV